MHTRFGRRQRIALVLGIAGILTLAVVAGSRGGSPRSPGTDEAQGRTGVRRAAVGNDDAGAQPALSTPPPAYRIIVSLDARRLWVTSAGDTVLTAPVAVSMPTALSYAGRVWRFATPRGERHVLHKEADPVWVPPDWHYAEIARDNQLRLDSLRGTMPVQLSDGRWLVMQRGQAGIVSADGAFAPLPVDEEIIFDSTLYIPPFGSKNRRVTGELGRYRLDLGGGYLLHGTPDSASIGTASTHGCLRLSDDAIEWLYRRIPVGTPVLIL